jgi:hypothetical protein
VVSGTGITVYANADWIPIRAQLAAKRAAAAAPGPGVLTGPPGSSVAPGAVPVLPGPAASRSFRGPLSVGTVVAALAPAGHWALTGPTGASAKRSPWFGWAASYQVTTPGVATIRFDPGVARPASLAFSVVVWLMAVALLVAGRLGGPWQRGRIVRRRIAVGQGHAVDGSAAVPTAAGVGSATEVVP